jgi:NAD(P)H dehydrogenase (quinone)
MSKILVTGATGNIGRLTLQHLLKRVPASDLVGLARDPAKAAELSAEGIEIRTADYLDYAGLVRSFAGIEKIMLVSATAFSDRNRAHENVINAAQEAGVRHIVYMPIIRKVGSAFSLSNVTEEDRFVEEKLSSSGLAHTLVRHPPFIESIEFYIGSDAVDKGVRTPAGDGKAAFASREDLAEAHATVLSEAGHEGKTYSLHGDPALSFEDIARLLSVISGKPVPHLPHSDEEHLAHLAALGLPEPVAQFALSWTQGVNRGEWDEISGDLERLLGRKPKTAAEFLRAKFASGTGEA